MNKKETELPKKLLLVNQSTTDLFLSLAKRLSIGSHFKSVTLFAGTVETDGFEQLPFTVVASTPLVRSPGWKRIASWIMFTINFVVQLFLRPPDIVVATTNPPLIPWVTGLLHFILRIPYIIIVYDIYPDVLDRMGYMKRRSYMYRFLIQLSAIAHSRAAGVVTLGKDMAKLICTHVQDPLTINVIPNWADTQKYRPIPKMENPFVQKYGLLDKFVVMYSGAFGATHDIDTILNAAARLVNIPNLVFVLVGKGTRIVDVTRKIENLNLPNVLLLPWQPISVTPLSLAAADCHIVTLDSSYAGVSFPSKFYTSLAVGSVILALAPDNTDLYDEVLNLQVGFSVPPGKSEELAAAVRKMIRNESDTAAMRSRSREAAEKFYDVDRCTGLYLTLIERVLRAEARKS